MAKKVVAYFMQGDGTIPVFIKDGGYFLSNFELVGVSVDETELYVPDSVVRLTRQQLIDRVKSLPYKNDITGEPKTLQEKEDMAVAWLAEKGLADYV